MTTCQLVPHVHTDIFQLSSYAHKEIPVHTVNLILYQFTVGDLLRTFHMRLSVVGRWHKKTYSIVLLWFNMAINHKWPAVSSDHLIFNSVSGPSFFIYCLHLDMFHSTAITQYTETLDCSGTEYLHVYASFKITYRIVVCYVLSMHIQSWIKVINI